MKIFKKLSALVLSLLAVILFSVSALAAESIDLSRTSNLAVTAVYDEDPISGMAFDAYLISTVDENGELTVTERYASHQADLDIQDKHDEHWHALAQVLAREILLDSTCRPTRSAVTNEDGMAAFSDIPMGLYLILGTRVEKDSYVYSTAPSFIMLPQQSVDGNTWNYDVVASAKLDQEPLRADYTVIKVWKDVGQTDWRPTSITISLICDRKIYDTVTLPHNGAWSYTWKELETNHHWTVMEGRMPGYRDPDIQQNGNTFIVTNTYNGPTAPTEPGKPTLPQTGQLWWPVPVLIAVGLFLVVLGLLRRRGTADEG